MIDSKLDHDSLGGVGEGQGAETISYPRMRSKWGREWRTSGNFGQVFVFNWNAINISVGEV